MIFLGFDTSTSSGSIALVAKDGFVAEWCLNIPRTHAERLLPGIRHLLSETGTRIGQIDGFAVTTGPGSFTGIRIALATAKALALATRKPLIGIPTLDVLVENVPFAPGLLCPALDAKKGEIFAALYRRDSHGQTHRLTDYLSVPPEILAARIEEPALLIGDAVPVYGERMQRSSRHRITLAPPEYHFPRASHLCRIAMSKLPGSASTHPRDVAALYARASDAELGRKRQKSRETVR